MEDLEKNKLTTNKVVRTSFLVDLSDVLLSLVIAVISGSVVMVSQTLEGFADLVASGLLIVGLRKSRRNPDHAHPFGFGREIYFWTLISALVMFGVSATLSFYLGWQRFFGPEVIHNGYLAIAVLFLTFFTNSYAFMLSLRRLLKKRDMTKIVPIFYRSSLVETKTTFILDLLGALASLLGMVSLAIYKITGDYRFDGLGAMVIGVVMAIFAYFLIMGIRDLLVGKSAPREVENRIKEATLTIKEVQDVLGLKTMHIGSEKLLVNLDVHLSAKLTTRQIEKLIDQIKAAVRKEVPSVKHIQVELETPD